MINGVAKPAYSSCELKGVQIPSDETTKIYFRGGSQEFLISLKLWGTLCGFYLKGTIPELWIKIIKTWQRLGYYHHNLLRTPFPKVFL